MGKIVAAMATVHAPQLFTRPPTEVLEQLDADVAAMAELGKSLDETNPDAIIIFGSDHLETFFLSSVPTFAIIAGETSKASFAGKDYDLPTHLPLAEHLLEGLVRENFDMSYSQDAILGHSFAAVYEFVIQGRKIPVIPILSTLIYRRCRTRAAAMRWVKRLPKSSPAALKTWPLSPAAACPLSGHVEISPACFRLRLLGYRADGTR